jgi:hypothetical protein
MVVSFYEIVSQKSKQGGSNEKTIHSFFNAGFGGDRCSSGSGEPRGGQLH